MKILYLEHPELDGGTAQLNMGLRQLDRDMKVQEAGRCSRRLRI